MKKRSMKLMSLFLSMTMMASGSVTAFAEAKSEKDFAGFTTELFSATDTEYWPETRWWLAEGSHTDETLKASIDELYNNGVGAVEFVTLNVASLSEDEELNNRYAWGSEEWAHDSNVIINYCTEKGMGVSFTSGTHWGTANLININPDMEEASQELGYTTTSISQGETFSGDLAPAELTQDAKMIRLIKVIAARVTSDPETGETMLDMKSVQDITDRVNGPMNKVAAAENTWNVEFEAADGDYEIFSFWQYGTSEYSQPAIGSGKSYTINYLSTRGSDAWIEYWDKNVIPDELKDTIRNNGDVSLYMDSLELQTAGTNTTGYFWSEEYLEEFEKRAGYDLTPYLPIVITSSTGSFVGGTMKYLYGFEGEEELCKKVRNDILQVNTELYNENCLDALGDWCSTFDMTVRAEPAYGQKFEVSESAMHVDYVETESFEFGNEIDSYRLLSGAAHLLNTTLSSETGATFGLNYKLTNNQWRNVFYTQFVSGINRTVMHGYASGYGPEGTVEWPGFEGMTSAISLRYSDRQPASVDFYDSENNVESGLSAHLAKIQTAMRQGVSLMDIAILRSDYNAENINGMSKSFDNNSLHSNKGIYWQDMTLQNSGYTYDYFSPLLLQNENVSWENGLLYGKDGSCAYQAVIIYQDDFPYECVDELKSIAEAGVPIIFVDTETYEHVRPSSEGGFMAPALAEGADYDDSDEEHKESSGWRTNESAALHTTFNDATDEELKAAIDEIRSYENVVSVTDIANTYAILANLGVKPRAEFAEQNGNLLTSLRQDGDTSYLLVYNYQYQDVNEQSVYYTDKEASRYDTEISFDGIVKPYVVDTWSGDTKEADVYRYEDGRTILSVNLEPGDITLFALDGSISEEEAIDTDNSRTLKDSISLENWNLSVESWTPGDAEYRYEYVYENADGESMRLAEESADESLTYLYTTTEYTYATNKNMIEAGTLNSLQPWKDLESVGDKVSGVGTYTTTFTLDNLDDSMKLYFNAESFCGGTARVLVNGQNVYVNMNSGTADISDAVVEGENTIEVRVTTTLTNALIESGWFGEAEVSPLSYGMIGATDITVF